MKPRDAIAVYGAANDQLRSELAEYVRQIPPAHRRWMLDAMGDAGWNDDGPERFTKAILFPSSLEDQENNRRVIVLLNRLAFCAFAEIEHGILTADIDPAGPPA